MPKTEHYQWYTEQFAPTELHAHAIEETYYAGRTPFQSVAVLRTAMFGKLLVLDGDTQSSQADEKIYHESLVHPAMAAAGERAEVLILGGGEGATLREVLRDAGSAALHDGRHRRRRGRARETLPARVVGRRVRRSARARLIIGDALRFLKDDGDRYDVVISDLTEPLPDSPSFPLFNGEVFRDIKARLAPGGVYVLQASTAGFHNMALHAKMARSLRGSFRFVRSFYTHVPAFDNDWAFLACSDEHDVAATPPAAHRRIRAIAGRRELVLRRRDAPPAVRAAALPAPRAGEGWRRLRVAPERCDDDRCFRRAAADRAARRPPGAGRADGAVRRVRDAGAVRRRAQGARRGAQARRAVRPLAHGAVRARRRRRRLLDGVADRQQGRQHEARPGALQHLHQRAGRRARRRDLLPPRRGALAAGGQRRQRRQDVGVIERRARGRRHAVEPARASARWSRSKGRARSSCCSRTSKPSSAR